MPDFTARFTAGVTPTIWTDDPIGGAPSRINPVPGRSPKYAKATAGVQVEIQAKVGGVEGPADGALGGRLFTGWFAEHPSPHPIAPTLVGGSTSIQRFTPTVVGHYLWCMQRPGGGTIALHLDVE